MSARIPLAYRFATPAQWARCITHRFDPAPGGALVPAQRLGAHAFHIEGTSAAGAVPSVAVDPHGSPFWLTQASGPLGRSPRLIADRAWVWGFEPGGTLLRRWDLEALQPDLSIDVEREIRDIASDGREGIWVLAAGSAPADSGGILVHFDCAGRPRERFGVPCEAASALQLGSLKGGRQLVLLAADRKRILLVDAAARKVVRVRSVGQLAPCWTVHKMAADVRNRIALWGAQKMAGESHWLLFVLDGSGDAVEGPIEVAFDAPEGAVPPHSLESVSVAVWRQTVWFGSGTGLWRLDPSESSAARESDSTLLTPAMYSPDASSDRGWLRAEAFIDLPEGAALEVHVASTDDPHVAAEAASIAADPSTVSEQKQQAIWELFDPAATRQYSFAGPGQPGVPVAIPLLEPRDRWLWLRISVITPPGNQPPPLRELRVLYPDLSLMQYLPAIFRGRQNDPTGELRAMAGVIESTSQRLDERIRSIGSFLEARTAPVEWLDFLARWLALPWDDELPDTSKRELIRHAGEILDSRGTRAGLMVLLRALLGKGASIQIVDLTVDYLPIRVGGCESKGGMLPGLLAGAAEGTPTIGGKAVVGYARLCGVCDPLATLVPTLRIQLTASRDTQRALENLMRTILLQYIPAGLALSVRWRIADMGASEVIGEDGIVLDDDRPGRLGKDAAIGRTLLAGTGGNRLDEVGLEIGFRLP